MELIDLKLEMNSKFKTSFRTKQKNRNFGLQFQFHSTKHNLNSFSNKIEMISRKIDAPLQLYLQFITTITNCVFFPSQPYLYAHI